ASPRILASTSPRPGPRSARPAPPSRRGSPIWRPRSSTSSSYGPTELALMVGLIVDWGGTGATNAGIGDSFTTVSPTFYIGQGLGWLPDQLSWARPFALTGEFSYNIPSSSFDFAE